MIPTSSSTMSKFTPTKEQLWFGVDIRSYALMMSFTQTALTLFGDLILSQTCDNKLVHLLLIFTCTGALGYDAILKTRRTMIRAMSFVFWAELALQLALGFWWIAKLIMTFQHDLGLIKYRQQATPEALAQLDLLSGGSPLEYDQVVAQFIISLVVAWVVHVLLGTLKASLCVSFKNHLAQLTSEDQMITTTTYQAFKSPPSERTQLFP